MKTLLATACITALILTSGCGESSFGGGGQQGPSASKDKSQNLQSDDQARTDGPETDANATAEEPQNDDDTITTLDLAETPDGAVIGKCLAEWGKTPFTKQSLAEHRTIEVQAQMLGRSDVQDLEPTDEPEIVVVKVASATLGAASLKLMNPQGWYCMDMSAQSLGATDVTLHCKAHIGNQSTSSGGLGRATLNKSCH